MIVRWSDANHTSEWNRWEYFNTNIITPYSANFFSNDSWGNCESSLVYENSENIYFGNSSSWLNVYAYAFHSSHPGEMGLGVWPGTLISDLSSDITFDNCSGLYRLAINQLIDDTIIFNSGSGSQTANLSIVGDNIYYKADYVTTGDTERGTAADFVYNLNNTRLVISASGDIKEDSICGISSTDATSICQNYNSLSSTIKGYISSSTIYTYTDQSSITADANIPVSSIMSQLSFISGVTLTSRLILSNSLSNNFSVLIAGIICTVGALTLSSFYLLKKKKSN